MVSLHKYIESELKRQIRMKDSKIEQLERDLGQTRLKLDDLQKERKQVHKEKGDRSSTKRRLRGFWTPPVPNKRKRSACKERGTSPKSNPVDSAGTDDHAYEIDAILDVRVAPESPTPALEYLIRWKGYDDSHNTWVKQGDMSAPILLKKFWSPHLSCLQSL